MLDRLYHHIALFLLLLYPILAYAVNDDEEGSPVFDTPVNKEVSIKVKSGKLAGTLTLPPRPKGKYPLSFSSREAEHRTGTRVSVTTARSEVSPNRSL